MTLSACPTKQPLSGSQLFYLVTQKQTTAGGSESHSELPQATGIITSNQIPQKAWIRGAGREFAKAVLFRVNSEKV